MVISIVFSILLSLLSLKFGKSKTVAALFFVFMWLLFGWNSWNGDYDAYEKLYNYPISELDTSKYEWGYSGLMLLFGQLGFSFQDFFIFISFVSMMLLFNFLIRYSFLPAFFSVLFFYSYFPLDYVLLRNFVAFVIVLQGLVFVINDFKHKIIIFVIFVFIASLFHGTSLFYLGFVLCFFHRKVSSFGISILVFLITLLYLYLGNYVMGTFFESSGRNDIYESSLSAFIVNAFLQILNLFIVQYFYNASLWTDGYTERMKRFNMIVMNMNVMLLFVIPLYYSYSIAIRLFWNVSLVNVVFMINTYTCYKEGEKKNTLLLLTLLYVFFFFMYMIAPFIDDTLFSLYKYNLIFD